MGTDGTRFIIIIEGLDQVWVRVYIEGVIRSARVSSVVYRGSVMSGLSFLMVVGDKILPP